MWGLSIEASPHGNLGSGMVLNQLGIAHVAVSVAKKPAPGAGLGAG